MILQAQAPRFETLFTGHYRESERYRVWRPHGTGDDLLIYTVAGGGRFIYPGGLHLTRPGELTLLRAGTPHDYGTDTQPNPPDNPDTAPEPEKPHWELLWGHFRPRAHWEVWLKWPQIAPGLLSLYPADPGCQRRIETALHQMHQLTTGGMAHREQWAMNALEQVWLEGLTPEFEARLDERVARAVSYLRAHLGEALVLSHLAEHCHLSVSRLGHLFTGQVGQSPLSFLEGERLARAAQLLALTSRNFSSIALEVGYPDPLYFSKRFRARMGRSPRQYRQDTLEGKGL